MYNKSNCIGSSAMNFIFGIVNITLLDKFTNTSLNLLYKNDEITKVPIKEK